MYFALSRDWKRVGASPPLKGAVGSTATEHEISYEIQRKHSGEARL